VSAKGSASVYWFNGESVIDVIVYLSLLFLKE
jgi:hypothetical protein